MEKELDLTLRLGLPQQSSNTPTSDQGANVGGRRDNNNDEAVRNNIRGALWGDGGDSEDEAVRNNILRALWGDGKGVDVNIRVSNYIFQLFADAPKAIEYVAPAPVNSPTRDYALLDVPANRAPRNIDEAVRNIIRGANWGDGEDEDVNIRVSNYIFQLFADAPRAIDFAPAPVTPPTRDYVLLDVPANRSYRNNSLAMTNVNSRWLHGGGRNEGTQKCTNINCNALTTSRWRRGPLGPKTLCNACGIKLWKEERKRSD